MVKLITLIVCTGTSLKTLRHIEISCEQDVTVFVLSPKHALCICKTPKQTIYCYNVSRANNRNELQDISGLPLRCNQSSCCSCVFHLQNLNITSSWRCSWFRNDGRNFKHNRPHAVHFLSVKPRARSPSHETEKE